MDLFPWAKFRRAKGGVKAHVLLDHDDYPPSYVVITEAKQSDVRAAQSLDLNAGSIVAMDRGYNDYALFGKMGARQEKMANPPGAPPAAVPTTRMLFSSKNRSRFILR